MKVKHRNRQERIPGALPEKVMLAALYGTPLLGCAWTVFGVCVADETIPGAILAIFAGVALVIAGISYFQAAMADFGFSESGVSVKYPLEKTHHIPWDDFQEVCVCFYSYGTEMYGFPIVCLVKNGERKNHFGRWKTANIFRHRMVLCLDYSEELLETVKLYCPYPIPDLRNQENYRL